MKTQKLFFILFIIFIFSYEPLFGMSKEIVQDYVTSSLRRQIILLPKNIAFTPDDYGRANVFKSDLIQNHLMLTTLKSYLDKTHSSLLRKVIIDRVVSDALTPPYSSMFFMNARHTLKEVPHCYLGEYEQFIINEYNEWALKLNAIKPLVLKRLYKKYAVPSQNIPQDVLRIDMTRLNEIIRTNRERKQAGAQEIQQIRDISDYDGDIINQRIINAKKAHMRGLLYVTFGVEAAENYPL